MSHASPNISTLHKPKTMRHRSKRSSLLESTQSYQGGVGHYRSSHPVSGCDRGTPKCPPFSLLWPCVKSISTYFNMYQGPRFGVVNEHPESPLKSYNWTPLRGPWYWISVLLFMFFVSNYNGLQPRSDGLHQGEVQSLGLPRRHFVHYRSFCSLGLTPHYRRLFRL